MIVAFFFAPLWLTTVAVGLVFAVWFTDLRPRRDRQASPVPRDGGEGTAPGLPSDWKLRSMLLGVVITLTAFCWEATPPITFDRATIPLGNGESLEVAYLSTYESATWFAACDRDEARSGNSTAISVPNARLGVLPLRTGGYRFYPEEVPTAGSVLFGLFGVDMPKLAVDVVRPAFETSLFDSTPVDERVVAGLCGNDAMSVEHVTNALQSLRTAN